METIIPGWAILVTTNWHKEEVISILAIYAPNTTTSGQENAAFWRKLKIYFVNNPCKQVDVMAGDFNVTEDHQDHAPMRLDPESALEALDDLKCKLRLTDG